MGKLPVGILWDGMKGHQMVTQIYTKTKEKQQNNYVGEYLKGKM